MEFFFLGTGAGTPSRQRNVTAIALQLFEERGVFWLFDCGEGTQHQILHSHLKLSKLEKIFISHLHGDHIYGLPGLLTSRSHQGATMPLTIYGPAGIRNYVTTCLTLSQAKLNYELHIVEIDEGQQVFSDHQLTVYAAQVEHRITCYGYRITEADRPGRLKAELLQQMGVPPGPLYAQIKSGNDVVLPDGRTLAAADFVEPAIRGRVVVIMGDTRMCDAVRELSQGADVLVHEATFLDELNHLAYEYYHTTALQAATLAAQCNVGQLIMTHISTRYQSSDVESILTEARQVHENSYVASDFSSFLVNRK